LNIVIVNDYGDVKSGAPTKIAVISARELVKQGHRVYFVHAAGPRSIILDHPNIRVHDLGLRDVWQERNPVRAAVSGVWNAAAGTALGRILADLDPRDTVIHLHQYTRSLSPVALKVAAESGVAWAVTLHDYFLVCPNGVYYDHHAGHVCSVKPLSLKCATTNCDVLSGRHKLVRLARQAATVRALAMRQQPLSVISPSPFARDVARPFLPGDSRYFVVPNPVDVECAPRAPVAGNRKFLFIGRLSPEKGVGVLAAAAKRAGVELSFVGAGPYEEALRVINPDAEFLPWTTRSDVFAHMDRARAIIFASLWYEPFGLSAMEAIARGVPLVASGSTALQNVITNGENGFLVEPGSVESLAQALSALKDAAVADRVGQAAWERYWHDPSTPARHAERVAAVYETMLAARRRPVTDAPVGVPSGETAV